MLSKLKITQKFSKSIIPLTLIVGISLNSCDSNEDLEADSEAQTTIEDNFQFNSNLEITDASGANKATLLIESNDQDLLEHYLDNTNIELGIIYPATDPFNEEMEDSTNEQKDIVENYVDGINISVIDLALPESSLGYYLIVNSKNGSSNERTNYDHYVTFNGGKNYHYGKVEYDDIGIPSAVVHVSWQYRKSKWRNWSTYNVTEILTQTNRSFSVHYSGKYLKAICESNYKNHKVYWKKNSGDSWGSEDKPE